MVFFVCVGLFPPSKKLLIIYLEKRGQKGKQQRKEKLVFHILHALTSGST